MFGQLIDMLRDVASGMQHIVIKGFVHAVSSIVHRFIRLFPSVPLGAILAAEIRFELFGPEIKYD